MNIGNTCRLGGGHVVRGVLRQLAVIKPSEVPSDPVDFLDKARIMFLDPNGRPVIIGSAVVTWEK